MALTTCPECGREISELALACPGCGAPGPAQGEAQELRPREGDVTAASTEPGTEPGSEEPLQSLEEIRAAWRAEHPHHASEEPSAGSARSPGRATGPSAPFGFGESLGDKWSARKVLYIVVGITLVAALIRPGLATVAILAGVVYWTANKLLAPGGRAAAAPADSGFHAAHELWQGIGVLGRAAVAVVVGVLLGFLTGAL
jgi:hypothetical protein